jgi:hypothetical protein
MELKLKAAMAASLLGGSVEERSRDGGRTTYTSRPSSAAISWAVKTAQEIWDETVRQEQVAPPKGETKE